MRVHEKLLAAPVPTAQVRKEAPHPSQPLRNSVISKILEERKVQADAENAQKQLGELMRRRQYQSAMMPKVSPASAPAPQKAIDF